MKGNRFVTIPEIEAATKERLKALTKDEFQSCFRSRQDRWNTCIDSKGDYFELLFEINVMNVFFLERSFTVFFITPHISLVTK
jgi:hypothetical protein